MVNKDFQFPSPLHAQNRKEQQLLLYKLFSMSKAGIWIFFRWSFRLSSGNGLNTESFLLSLQGMPALHGGRMDCSFREAEAGVRLRRYDRPRLPI